MFHLAFKPVASIGDVEMEVPSLDVSECSPGRHVRGGHAWAALAFSCHYTDDDDMSLPGDSGTRRAPGGGSCVT